MYTILVVLLILLLLGALPTWINEGLDGTRLLEPARSGLSSVHGLDGHLHFASWRVGIGLAHGGLGGLAAIGLRFGGRGDSLQRIHAALAWRSGQVDGIGCAGGLAVGARLGWLSAYVATNYGEIPIYVGLRNRFFPGLLFAVIFRYTLFAFGGLPVAIAILEQRGFLELSGVGAGLRLALVRLQRLAEPAVDIRGEHLLLGRCLCTHPANQNQTVPTLQLRGFLGGPTYG